MNDLAFSFDNVKVRGDRAWSSKKDVLIKSVGSARFPVEDQD
ncbi:hypothetical protein [Saccharolobus islandicus]|nr:hypothetical protein [Sulfolobus islandicus]